MMRDMAHLASMTKDSMDGVQMPSEVKEWYRKLCSKAGSSIPHETRVRAAKKSSKRSWKTRRRLYGLSGHSGPYAKAA